MPGSGASFFIKPRCAADVTITSLVDDADVRLERLPPTGPIRTINVVVDHLTDVGTAVPHVAAQVSTSYGAIRVRRNNGHRVILRVSPTRRPVPGVSHSSIVFYEGTSFMRLDDIEEPTSRYTANRGQILAWRMLGIRPDPIGDPRYDMRGWSVAVTVDEFAVGGFLSSNPAPDDTSLESASEERDSETETEEPSDVEEPPTATRATSASVPASAAETAQARTPGTTRPSTSGRRPAG
jgi:hypothetical protein